MLRQSTKEDRSSCSIRNRSFEPLISDSAPRHPLIRLQRSVGNQAVGRLLRAGGIQTKLRVSQPGDLYEQEADRIADHVMRMQAPRATGPAADSARLPDSSLHRKCASCEEEEAEKVHAKSVGGPGPLLVPEVGFHLWGLRGGGQPLPESVRAYFEPRFGRHLSQVRIHTDSRAAESARTVNALAFTFGRDIVFATGQFAPHTSSGLRLLSHELAHVLQQNHLAAARELPAPEGTTFPMPVMARHGSPPLLMRLTPDDFKKNLGSTTEQKAAITALFANKTFLALWKYLEDCKATPKQDLGPLGLDVQPGLSIGGVERFGGYDPVARSLIINPTKPEHTANPAELVDTIAHELIHAVDDLEADCKTAGSPATPLKGAATVSPPTRAAIAGKPKEEKKLMEELGPGASNPCEEFLDINKVAQQMVIQIIRENIKVAKVGKPTVTFVNEILRRNPKAMKAYVACRGVACKETDVDKRRNEVAKCSEEILTKFMPKGLAV